jgi:hypothetical protein
MTSTSTTTTKPSIIDLEQRLDNSLRRLREPRSSSLPINKQQLNTSTTTTNQKQQPLFPSPDLFSIFALSSLQSSPPIINQSIQTYINSLSVKVDLDPTNEWYRQERDIWKLIYRLCCIPKLVTPTALTSINRLLTDFEALHVGLCNDLHFQVLDRLLSWYHDTFAHEQHHHQQQQPILPIIQQQRDPDGPLTPQEQQANELLLQELFVCARKGAFYFVSSSDPTRSLTSRVANTEAAKLCGLVRQPWRMASLIGGKPMHVVYDRNDVNHIDRVGNAHRASWKLSCGNLSRHTTSSWEGALYALLNGDRSIVIRHLSNVVNKTTKHDSNVFAWILVRCICEAKSDRILYEYRRSHGGYCWGLLKGEVDAVSQDELAMRAKKYADRTEFDVFQEIIAQLQSETVDLTARLFFVHAQEALACGNIHEQLVFFERKLCSGLGFTNLVRYTCGNLSPFMVRAGNTLTTGSSSNSSAGATGGRMRRKSTSSIDNSNTTTAAMDEVATATTPPQDYDVEEFIEYIPTGSEDLSPTLENEERKEDRGERLRFIVHLCQLLLEGGVNYEQSVCPMPRQIATGANNTTNATTNSNLDSPSVILKVAYCRFLFRVGKTALIPFYACSLPTEPRVAILAATLEAGLTFPDEERFTLMKAVMLIPPSQPTSSSSSNNQAIINITHYHHAIDAIRVTIDNVKARWIHHVNPPSLILDARSSGSSKQQSSKEHDDPFTMVEAWRWWLFLRDVILEYGGETSSTLLAANSRIVQEACGQACNLVHRLMKKELPIEIRAATQLVTEHVVKLVEIVDPSVALKLPATKEAWDWFKMFTLRNKIIHIATLRDSLEEEIQQAVVSISSSSSSLKDVQKSSNIQDLQQLVQSHLDILREELENLSIKEMHQFLSEPWMAIRRHHLHHQVGAVNNTNTHFSHTILLLCELLTSVAQTTRNRFGLIELPQIKTEISIRDTTSFFNPINGKGEASNQYQLILKLSVYLVENNSEMMKMMGYDDLMEVLDFIREAGEALM